MRLGVGFGPFVTCAILSSALSSPLAYFTDHWRPDRAACSRLVRLGNGGDGGKIACRVAPPAAKPCLIYSVGSNNDFSFEVAAHGMYPQCEIHTFDPTVDFPRPPSFVTFHQTTVPLTPPGPLFMLKMDCEGCEYADLPFLAPEAMQIFVEVHPCLTRSVDRDRVLLETLARTHTLFSREHNTHGIRPGCMELSWIKMGR